MYDIDSDGIQDVAVATYDGEVVFFKDTVSSAGTSRSSRGASAGLMSPLSPSNV
jgi:hypothetical protein